MADWDGRKSPLGCHWAVPLLPGSDTDFHAVRPGTGCFSLGKRMLFVREMDRLALEDGEALSALKKLTSILECGTWSGLSTIRELEHLVALSSVAEVADIKKRLESVLTPSEIVVLNSLRRIYFTTFGIPLDSVNLSVYSKGKEDSALGEAKTSLESHLPSENAVLGGDELFVEAGYGRTLFGIGGYGL